MLEAAGERSAGVIPLTNQIVRQLDAEARPLGTANELAYAAFIEGLERGAPEAFDRSTALDPAFAAAYIAKLQLAVARQDRAAAARIVEQARAANLSEVDLARLDADAGLLSDPDERLKKLESLAKLIPSDVGVLRTLGSAALALRQYQDAIAALRRAAELEPENVATWNNLGYAYAYLGDLEKATKMLQEYKRLQPSDPNPSDSLGEVHFYLGRFREAEELFREAYRKDASFLGGATLAKAAQARFLAGDLKRADAQFDEFLTAQRAANSAAAKYWHAQWKYMTGRKREAADELEELLTKHKPQQDVSSHSYSQLAMWRLLEGDRSGARGFAQSALLSAVDGQTAAVARIVGFASAPTGPAPEWTKRAGLGFPGSQLEAVKGTALAVALLLDGRFDAALPIVSGLYEKSPPSPSSDWPPLLGWCLLENRRLDEASQLLSKNYLVPFTSPTPLVSIWAPRLAEWRKRSLRAGVKDRGFDFTGALHLNHDAVISRFGKRIRERDLRGQS